MRTTARTSISARGGIRRRREAGYGDTMKTLEKAPWRAPVDEIEGFILHEASGGHMVETAGGARMTPMLQRTQLERARSRSCSAPSGATAWERGPRSLSSASSRSAAMKCTSSIRSSCSCRCSTGCTRNTRRARHPTTSSASRQLYRSVDGFLIVSGEYNHGIPPALKNLLDHFLEEYFWRPSGIVCYSAGGFGGVRAAMQLRMTLAELGMPSIPSLLPIPRIAETIGDDGARVRHHRSDR